MDVILPMLGALAAASSVTWAIFRLNARAVGWTSRQLGLMWLAGGGVSVACAIATAHVPIRRERMTSVCDPARDAACRPSGPARITPSGETLCCYPGTTEWTLEGKTTLGESLKIALIMTIVGTIFGLIILTRTWLGGRLAGDPGRRT